MPDRDYSTTNNKIELNLLDYIEVIVKHYRFILKITIATFVFSVTVSYILPVYYSSTARIIPPQQDNGFMGMMMGAMSGGMASLAGDLLGKGSPADLYVGILNSRTISDTIIDRFKLMEIYGNKYRLDAYRSLDSKVSISAGKKDGIISITVEDKDPKRAADMANAYVSELGVLTVQLNITDANNNKLFIERRLSQAKADLANAEDRIKEFQSRYKVLDITEQAKETIKGVAELEAQLATEEVKLEGIKRIFTESSQEVKNQQAIVGNIKKQILKLEGGRAGGSVPSVGSVPEIGQQYSRLLRTFKIQETLVEMLTKQYEMTKLSEAKEITSIQVLQKAQIPDKKIKPKRSLLVLASTITAVLVSIAYILVREAIERMSDEERQHMNRILSTIKSGSSGATN